MGMSRLTSLETMVPRNIPVSNMHQSVLSLGSGVNRKNQCAAPILLTISSLNGRPEILNGFSTARDTRKR